MEVDSYGLDECDVKLLRTIIEKFDGGPVGLGTSRRRSPRRKGLDREIIEPYLFRSVF